MGRDFEVLEGDDYVMYPGSIARRLRDYAEGREQWNEPDAKRQHFIPRFQLSYFVDPESPRQRLWQLDKFTGRIDPVSVEGAASRDHLYRLDHADGGKTNVLEAFLGVIEDEACHDYTALLTPGVAITPSQRANLGFLIASQKARTIEGQRRATELFDAYGRLITATDIANGAPPTLGGHDDRTFPGWSDETVEALRSGTVRITGGREAGVIAMLTQVELLAGLVADLRWTRMTSTTATFVLGDHALAWKDPTPAYPWSVPAPRSSPAAYGLFPLSPNVCLRLDSQPDPWHLMRNVHVERAVAKINQFSYAMAGRHVFAQNRSSLEELHAWATNSPEEVPSKPRFGHVVCEEADPSDPTVGRGHPDGWPRGIWVEGHTPGTQRFMAYEVYWADDDRVPELRPLVHRESERASGAPSSI